MEPSIYKPSIYKGAGIYKAGAEGGGGGGGGGGIIKALYNQSTNANHFLTLSNLSLTFYDKFEFVYIPISGRGIFSCSNSNDKGIAFNDSNYLDLSAVDYGSYGGDLPGVSYGFVNKVTIKVNSVNTLYNVKNGLNETSGTLPATYKNYSLDRIKIFKGRNSYNCGILNFIGLNVFDVADNIKYEFRPETQNGVDGLIENINGVFTPVPFTDGTMKLVEINNLLE